MSCINCRAIKQISDATALEFLYSDVSQAYYIPYACIRLVFFQQAQSHVLSGYYPCSEDDALHLAGITMQVSTHVAMYQCPLTLTTSLDTLWGLQPRDSQSWFSQR